MRGRYVLVQWHLDAKAAFRWAKHGVLGTALALVAAERNLAVELHGSPCSPRTFGVVEVRGVEPLTFSMPFPESRGTDENAKRQARIFGHFVVSADLLKINEPHLTLCMPWFCCKPPPHPRQGNSRQFAPSSPPEGTDNARMIALAVNSFISRWRGTGARLPVMMFL